MNSIISLWCLRQAKVACRFRRAEQLLVQRAPQLQISLQERPVWSASVRQRRQYSSNNISADGEKVFRNAVAAINGDQPAPVEVTNSTKLKLYALFKQAAQGPCDSSNRPSMFDPVGRAKFDAWQKLGAMTAAEAKQQYVAIVTELFEGSIPVATNTVDTAATAVVSSNSEASIKSTAAAASVVEGVPPSVAAVAFPHLQQQHNAAASQLATSLSTIRCTSYTHSSGSDNSSNSSTTKSSSDSNNNNNNNNSDNSSDSNGVFSVELHRPKRGNAFNMQMWSDLRAVFTQLIPQQQQQARVVVLTGSGSNFSTGMDLTVFAEMQQCMALEQCEGRQREAMGRFIGYLQDAISLPEQCAVPVIAAVSGNCIGGAIDLITACDLRYCTKDAQFCVKETDLAIVADIGTLQRLPRIVGMQRAAELTFTGRTFNGTEAKAMGLVLDCFEDQQQMMQHVHHTAALIAKKSPLTIRGAKRVLLYASDHSLPDSLNQVRLWNSAHLPSADLQEAMRAAITGDNATFNT